MLCKCHWIVLYTVHFTAFLGRPFFSGHGVYYSIREAQTLDSSIPLLTLTSVSKMHNQVVHSDSCST